MWIDGKWKVPCKCRFDAVNRGGGIDLKTTQDASPEAFARTIATYRYDLQAAWYLSGAEHVLDETPQFFAFIVVEAEPPHAVACYAIGPASVQAGAARAEVALERYAKALAAGEWPGYEPTIQPIEMPSWARRIDL
jgi:exodeoxyribonuclease VIII